MLPDISIRINNLIKSMEKTIGPAIDPENGMAQEQAALLIGHLKMLDQQWDTAYLYEKGSLDNMRALAAQLVPLGQGNATVTQAVEALSSLLNTLPSELPLTVSGINALTINTGNAIDTLINQCFEKADKPLKDQLTNAILDYNSKQSARERVWFRANNLDPDSSDLSTMDEMLFTDIYQYMPE